MDSQWGVYEYDGIVNIFCVDDWKAEWLIIASNEIKG